jgi:hypothetical protein
VEEIEEDENQVTEENPQVMADSSGTNRNVLVHAS